MLSLTVAEKLVTLRIIDMSDDVKSMLTEYEFEGMSHEDFLFFKTQPTGTTGEHLFQLLNEFIEENGIDWIKCVGICTDGARAMTSQHSLKNLRGCSRYELQHPLRGLCHQENV
ncbi:ZMYM6 protein, partial [Atractosteus spatula]|nr:ZMYM6 protein [Atractosteus spatula]